MKQLYVLIACEESQAECKAFRELGHIAFSCDIKKCRKSGNAEWHIHGDVTPYLDGETHFITQSGQKVEVPGWDLIIAHPPCTYLCKVGSVHLFHGKELNRDRLKQMIYARDFFLKCLNANVHYLAVENPLPMALACLPPPSTYIQPSWFGVNYTKKTLYWLKNLPPITPTVFYPDPKSFHHCSRGYYRSRTFPQVAEALAKQWSTYILDEFGATQ